MIQIVRWRDFQHYKRRRAPWIRLYASLLDDREYRQLSCTARSVLVDLWCLASETLDGCLHVASNELAWRLRESVNVVSAGLHELAQQVDSKGKPKWILIDASNMLASCEQTSTPETEAEAEAENRLSADADAPSPGFVRSKPPKPKQAKTLPESVGWVAEAAALYAEHIGVLSHGQMGGALKVVVGQHTWTAVKPWFEGYCRLRPYKRFEKFVADKDTSGCSPADFVRNLTYWQEMQQPYQVPA